MCWREILNIGKHTFAVQTPDMKMNYPHGHQNKAPFVPCLGKKPRLRQKVWPICKFDMRHKTTLDWSQVLVLYNKVFIHFRLLEEITPCHVNFLIFKRNKASLQLMGRTGETSVNESSRKSLPIQLMNVCPYVIHIIWTLITHLALRLYNYMRMLTFNV